MEGDVTVTAPLTVWLDVLTDLDAFESAIGARDLEYTALEPGTEQLIELLRLKAVAL
jgi:hypothetical protein